MNTEERLGKRVIYLAQLTNKHNRGLVDGRTAKAQSRVR